MKKADERGIFFDSKHLGEPVFEYVCWIDVMGSANQMLRSLPISANFIFKLHCAILEAYDEINRLPGIRLYPVMDGAYITSERRDPLRDLINQCLVRIVTTFMQESKPYLRFLVRGALAYGPIYHGTTLDPKTSWILNENTGVRDSILMGLPMAQAYQAERDAPPFGIAAHSSARAFAPEGDSPFSFIWLDWFRYSKPLIDTGKLKDKLDEYFKWQTDHCNMTGYDPLRIAHHQKLAAEYLTAS